MGSRSFTLAVIGADFDQRAIVYWNGQQRTTRYGSPNELYAAISNDDVATAGTATVMVVNGSGLKSNGVKFTIYNPTPAISSLEPRGATAGGSSFTLKVLGDNFVSTSKVHWNGQARPTRYGGSGELYAAISSDDIAKAGTYKITVVSPGPGGGESKAVDFYVTVLG